MEDVLVETELELLLTTLAVAELELGQTDKVQLILALKVETVGLEFK
jgi:hypothetical protein